MPRGMRVMISGGGTGGHVYPGIAIADAIKRLFPDSAILFVGAHNRLEMQKVPQAGYDIVGLRARGWQRKRWWTNWSLPWYMLMGLIKARHTIQTFKPDVVVGTGGYVSIPVLWLASMLKIPTLIQEQNALPGLANRRLSKRVDVICVAYESAKAHFPSQKVSLTGNPLRAATVARDNKRLEAQQHFRLAAHLPCLLVVGGSLGAKALNLAVHTWLSDILRMGFQVLWITGQAHIAEVEGLLAPEHRQRVRSCAFTDRMDLAYAAADLVISRAGALAVSELCVVGKPTILVPSAHAVANHQFYNAQPLAQARAVCMLNDTTLVEDLGPALRKLWSHSNERVAQAERLKSWARPQAADQIARYVHGLATGSFSLQTE